MGVRKYVNIITSPHPTPPLRDVTHLQRSMTYVRTCKWTCRGVTSWECTSTWTLLPHPTPPHPCVAWHIFNVAWRMCAIVRTCKWTCRGVTSWECASTWTLLPHPTPPQGTYIKMPKTLGRFSTRRLKHHQHGGPQTDAPATFHEKTWKKGKTLKQTQIHGLKLSWKKEGYRLSPRNNIVVSGEPWLTKKTFGANPNQYYQNGFKRGLANSSWDSICCQQVHQSLTRDTDKYSHNGVLHHGYCFKTDSYTQDGLVLNIQGEAPISRFMNPFTVCERTPHWPFSDASPDGQLDSMSGTKGQWCKHADT